MSLKMVLFIISKQQTVVLELNHGKTKIRSEWECTLKTNPQKCSSVVVVAQNMNVAQHGILYHLKTTDCGIGSKSRQTKNRNWMGMYCTLKMNPQDCFYVVIVEANINLSMESTAIHCLWNWFYISLVQIL